MIASSVLRTSVRYWARQRGPDSMTQSSANSAKVGVGWSPLAVAGDGASSPSNRLERGLSGKRAA